jgi:hypothetical protein
MVGAYGAWQSPVDTIHPAAVALGRKDRLMEELAHAPLTPEARRDREESDQEVTEVPNMPQRTVMQCLSLGDWKVVAHLPVPVGELMVNRLLEYGWIESRSEKQGKAIRLTPAELKALRSV